MEDLMVGEEMGGIEQDAVAKNDKNHTYPPIENQQQQAPRTSSMPPGPQSPQNSHPKKRRPRTEVDGHTLTRSTCLQYLQQCWDSSQSFKVNQSQPKTNNKRKRAMML
ncbi:hypothetical protein C5167_029772 [Papaver somniferum]|nr:hypothetical protein C5167_029772 [Papaver somniferum]